MSEKPEDEKPNGIASSAHESDAPESGDAEIEGAEGGDAGPSTERPAAPDAPDASDLGSTLDEAPAVDAELDAIAAGYTDVEVTVNLTADVEQTVNLTGDLPMMPLRDDAALDEETPLDATSVARAHLKGLLEALVFVSDGPIKAADLAKSASAPLKEVKEILAQLRTESIARGVQLEEVAGGWVYRTNAAYPQPITRPEIDEIRGVDSGPVLKVLLERDLVKILGKKDEPGRPLLYGTTTTFLEFFGLRSLKDLPTLKEFTELNEESRRVVETELGETLESVQAAIAAAAPVPSDAVVAHDTSPPGEEAPTADLGEVLASEPSAEHARAGDEADPEDADAESAGGEAPDDEPPAADDAENDAGSRTDEDDEDDDAS